MSRCHGDSNDYEDVPDLPLELEKRTFSNTHSNMGPPPPPKLPRSFEEGSLDRSVSPQKLPQNFEESSLERSVSPKKVDMLYSKVNKLKSHEKDEMEREGSTSPVINGYYVSTDEASFALAQEMDRLANDLENSRAIVKQWTAN